MCYEKYDILKPGLTIFLTGFLIFQGFSRTIQVCSECKILSLEIAIASSDPGDTIEILKGTYSAVNLEIRHPLTLIGEDGAILDGEEQGYILKVLSDSVNIHNLKLINAGRSYTKDFAAVYTNGIQYFNFSKLDIVDPFFGFLIEKSKNGNISHNRVYGQSKREDDSGNGIHIWHCDNVTVKGNEVYGVRDGIYLEFVENSDILENLSHDNIRYGLHFMFSNNDRYLNNTFENNGSGVAVMFSKFIVMRSNHFIKNWGSASYGLLLKEIYDAEVEQNLFEENTIAVFTEGSTRVNYRNNDFIRNGWAVKVSGGCYTNHFIQNNFVGNSFDVSYNSKMNDNKFESNYWASYSGYDLDKDGYGDVPHRPVKLFSYVVNETPETVILLRSLFVDIINFSERVSPVFTPDDLVDPNPLIRSMND